MNTKILTRIALTTLVFMAIAATGRAWPWRGGQEGLSSFNSSIRRKFPRVPQITPATLATRIADPSRPAPQLLDVREPAEFAVSRLPGAMRVNPSALAGEVTPRLQPGRPVVVYCSAGYRSSRLAERLIAAGVPEVSNLEGSIFAWANEGRPLESDAGRVRAVHPYNAFFGRLLKPELRAKTPVSLPQRARSKP
jgi:rhodanese-related sulfurtransferase